MNYGAESQPSPGQGGSLVDRPVPFLLRVAAEWYDMETFDSDEVLFFAKSASLTGEIAVTAGGQDVTMSDIEL